jgi:hypothetical protein
MSQEEMDSTLLGILTSTGSLEFDTSTHIHNTFMSLRNGFNEACSYVRSEAAKD